MKHRFAFAFIIALFACASVFAQQAPRHEEPQHEERSPHANGGHVPTPPPPHAPREVEKGPDGRVIEHPHVNNDHWYGHAAVDDRRFHLDHPFPHGHFQRFGPTYRYNVVRVDVHAHRFWLPGGFFFEIAAWDWAEAASWCWNCGSDFVVYEDPDHPGWYLVYDTQTGVYVHAQYLGS